MVDRTVLAAVKRYLAALPEVGIRPSRAVLFGSVAHGKADEWSDIDLIVIAPEFDGEYDRSILEELWGARSAADIRLEPIPCGEQEWETDASRPLLTIARREGIVIAA